MTARWSGPLFEGHECSLGYVVLDWIHEFCCHGPGDVQGEPLDYDDEIRDFIINCYRINPVTGRRLYREAVLSRPKGRAKSEIAGMVVCAEALGPVRFDGWDAAGQPVGRPVVSPLIKCLATEESQAGNTFENAAFVLGEWGPDVHPDVFGGVTGVRKYQSASAVYVPGGGEVRASTSGAASKDGGKETFVVPDESHLYVLPELQRMYATVMRNLPKRKAADPWALQTTTAYRIGEQSIAEQTLTSWRKGTLPTTVLVDHREARGKVDIEDRDRTLRQLREVYGPAMDPVSGWMDAEATYDTMRDPKICPDEATAARYYLNRAIASADAWIATGVHEAQSRPGRRVEPGEAITVGFDGSLNEDSTVLRGCFMSDGHLFRLGVWEKPEGPAGIGWRVPRLEVLAAIRAAHRDYRVVRGYYDPHEWRSDVETLASELGDEVVVEYPTSSHQRMHDALDRLHTDLVNGDVTHDGDPIAGLHYGNAYVTHKGRFRLVRKEYPNSPRKIDTVIGDALALQARSDAIETGWGSEPEDTRVFCFN